MTNGAKRSTQDRTPLWIEVVRGLVAVAVALVTALAAIQSRVPSAVETEAKDAVPDQVRTFLGSLELPIGTVLPFFGSPEALDESGWVLCDGRTIPDGSPLKLDADPRIGGRQVPDLRGRFIAGLEAGQALLGNDGGLFSGGTATIPKDRHQHRWSRWDLGERTWFSYRKTEGEEAEEKPVMHWIDGFDDGGTGINAIAVESTIGSQGFYTEVKEHDHGGVNLPLHVRLHYIIRVQ